MTQVIGAITQDYVVLASDRRLSDGRPGPTFGKVIDDEACKLVSFCNQAGIGYTGFARMGPKRMRTHDWIANILAAEGCRNAQTAMNIIGVRAEQTLRGVTPRVPQAFLMVGWAEMKGEVCPYWSVVSNCYDEKLQALPQPREFFSWNVLVLPNNGPSVAFMVVGQPLEPLRADSLLQACESVTRAQGSAEQMQQLLIEEIIHTSQSVPYVGSRILAMSFPKATYLRARAGAGVAMIAGKPIPSTPSFTYFKGSFSERFQYGPAFTCGGSAHTDLETSQDGDNQSVQFRILRRPK